MNREAFTAMIDAISGTFNRQIAPKTASRIYERVGDLPDDAVPYIIAQIENMDTLPSNIGKAIVGFWFQWRNENPDRCASDVRRCGRCENGMVYVVAPGWQWPRIAACGLCRGEADRKMPRSAPNQDQADGTQTFGSYVDALRVCIANWPQQPNTATPEQRERWITAGSRA